MNVKGLISELSFKAIKSSGSGGQHVNKVSSKVELQFDVVNSRNLNDHQKELLLIALKNRLTNDNFVLLQCGDTRSQHKNKELVIERFIEIIKEGLKVKKKRRPTKIPKAVIKKRMDDKQKQSLKKTSRKKPDFD